MTFRSILVICDAVGATQNISLTQPLAADVAAGKLSYAVLGHDTAWANEKAWEAVLDHHRPELLVLSRYTALCAPALIATARAHGAAILFHIDDDLLEVPISLGLSKYEHYNHPDRLAGLRSAMGESDLVYASTSELALRLKQHGVQTPIMAGRIYCSVNSTSRPKNRPSSGPVIGYMATGGHGADLELALPAIVRLLQEFPELRFETFGTIKPPASLAAFGERTSHHKGMADYERFLERLAHLGWWIGIAPLEDTPFNRCKADTKWVEYAYSGIATVASDLPVYHSACEGGAGVLARTEQDWYEALRKLIVDRNARQNLLTAAADRLAQRYDQDVLARQLYDIFDHAHQIAQRR